MNTPKHASLAAKIAGVGMAAAVAVGASAGAAVAAPSQNPRIVARGNQRTLDLTQITVTVRTRGRFLVNPFTRPGKLIGFSGVAVNCTRGDGTAFNKIGQLSYGRFGIDARGPFTDLTFDRGLFFGGKALTCQANAGILNTFATGTGQYVNGPGSTVAANFVFNLA